LAQNISSKKWSVKKATKWYNQQEWIIGCNYIPRTAINPIEMWQEATFDPNTIDQELRWAENIGFNTIRVFLHYLNWYAARKITR
jgi:endo-1,4-beta-mannosidase